ncbi:hypothetical protein [Streptomyces sp. NPDC007074]|uniref:hypothetical protein n=1 Tax=Streptomyces sp. NPDC007074 TaxID=3156764 RepID=UPI0033D2D1D2
MTDPTTVQDVKAQAIDAWYQFTSYRNLQARVPDWREATTPDGTPRLVSEVVGPGAAHTLHLFASQWMVRVEGAGGQRPVFDYSTPGRVTCVWRTRGVWVELWHPDPTTVPLTPVPAPSLPSPRRAFSRPSGRLPFTRRSKAQKETTTP